MSRLHTFAVTAVILATVPATAPAQTSDPRFTVGAVAVGEHTTIENGDGAVAATGISLSVRVTRFASVYGEVTAGWGEVVDSYEGEFSPGAVMRRDRTWEAGIGSGFGVSLHTPPSARAGVKLSIGAAGRSFDLTDTLSAVRRPEEGPESRATDAVTTHSSRQHGGATIALGVPINVTRRLVVEPEARWLQTFADEDFASLSFGVRAGWRF